MRKRLTRPQEAFVTALVRDPLANGAKAARAAGYSAATANAKAWELLHHPRCSHVQEALQARRNELAKEFDIEDADIWRGIVSIAKGDVSRIVQWGTDESGKSWVRYTPVDELSPHEAALIKNVRVFVSPHGEQLQIELHSRLEAWFMLAKMCGLIGQRIEVDVTEQMQKARASLKERLAKLGEQHLEVTTELSVETEEKRGKAKK